MNDDNDEEDLAAWPPKNLEGGVGWLGEAQLTALHEHPENYKIYQA